MLKTRRPQHNFTPTPLQEHPTLGPAATQPGPRGTGDRGTYGRRSDFADPRFLGYRSYFVDVGEGVGELLPAGLEHRTLRRGHELLELRRAHRCTAVRDEARRW